MRDAVVFIKGHLNIESFLHAMDLWLGASHLPFRHIVKDGMHRCIIQHELGRKWSIYLATVANSLLAEIDYYTKNQKVDDQSVSFEIVQE